MFTLIAGGREQGQYDTERAAIDAALAPGLANTPGLLGVEVADDKIVIRMTAGEASMAVVRTARQTEIRRGAGILALITRADDRDAIIGNTYPHREALKAMGGEWDAAQKAWKVPANRAEEARALVGAQVPAKPRRQQGVTTHRHAGTCWECGAATRRIQDGAYYCGRC